MSEQAQEEKKDPEAFEELLEPLHQAFLRASAIMAEIGIHGKNYWAVLHAAEELLGAMGHLENAAFEWRSYTGRHDERVKEKEDEVREQQETLAYLKKTLDEDRLSDRPLFPKDQV